MADPRAPRPPTDGTAEDRPTLVARGRRSRGLLGARLAELAAAGSAIAIAALLALLLLVLGSQALPAVGSEGLGLLTGRAWDPVHERFGAAPAIVGTLLTSGLAIAIATPIALGAALFLSTLGPRRLRAPLAAVVDLAAAVPSVVLGLWGALIVVPFMAAEVEPALARLSGGAGPFAGPPEGADLLTASLLLAVMIVPTIATIARAAFAAVPRTAREAALGIGAGRWESVRLAVLRPAMPSVVGAVLLGLGRALGETIVVAMTIGNVYGLPSSLFGGGQTIPSQIVDELPGASSAAEQSALVALGLLLLAISLAVGLLARLLASGRLRWRSLRRGRASPRRLVRPLATANAPDDRGGADLPIDRAVATRRRRRAADRAIVAACALATLLALAPLVLVVTTAVENGGAEAVRPSFYTQRWPSECLAASLSGCPSVGGIGPAIEGTLLLVGLASLIALPVGTAAGVYLSEFGRGRITGSIRFALELLVGVPSILIGLVVFGLLLQTDRSIAHSAISGSLALAVLMLPIVATTTEIALRGVPLAAREAALALGYTRARVAWRVVLPAARPALLSGAFLAVARAGSETAALVFTAFGNPSNFLGGLGEPVQALPPLIFQYGLTAYPNWTADIWGATLVLLLVMLTLGLVARLAAGAFAPSEGAE